MRLNTSLYHLHVAAFATASGAAEKQKVQQRRIMSKDKIPGSMSKLQ
jgi:hypothetical protein